MKQRKSDILWKVIMEEVFPDLLRFIYPDADDVYNLDMSSNPFAQVIVAAKMRLQEGKISEDELLNNKLLAARKLTEKGFGMEKDPSHL